MDKLVTDIQKFTNRVKIFHTDVAHDIKQEIWGEFKTVIGARGKIGLIQSYLNDEQLPMFFSDSNLVDEIKKVNHLDTSRTFDNDKVTIFELEIHPIETENVYSALEKFFTQFTDLIPLMQNNKVLCLIWFGWEADNWTTRDNDLNTSHYDLIVEFQKKYEIPAHSMVFLHSNLRGEELENEHYKDKDKPTIWYDYYYEFESFVRRKNSSPLVYPFEDYFNRLKSQMKYKFLRVNRTWNNQRDVLAYSIYKMGYFKDCNWEIERIEKEQLLKELKTADEEAIDREKLKSILKHYNPIDELAIDELINKLPLISSEEERRLFKLKSDHRANETVPASIYTSAPISYISTSFPQRDDQVFLHMSTFNPIWNYHPILFNGNPYTLREMKRVGFKTFEYLFNEDYDSMWWERDRLMNTLIEFEKVVQYSDNKILDIIYNNQEDLIHNRNLLISLQSYRRFFEKINKHLDLYYDKK
jgi:hypothetical protein